jgi:CRISPR-associated protein Cas2
MLVLVCYDVAADPAGAKRLRRISEACKDYGVRVQYSVFECRIADREWVVLRGRLLGEYDAAQDSLRFYFLREDASARTEHHGVRPPMDPAGPLVF